MTDLIYGLPTSANQVCIMVAGSIPFLSQLANIAAHIIIILDMAS